MSVQNILLYLPGYYGGVSFQCWIEFITQFGGNLVTYVYKLTEIRIVERILKVVAKCPGILLAAP